MGTPDEHADELRDEGPRWGLCGDVSAFCGFDESYIWL